MRYGLPVLGRTIEVPEISLSGLLHEVFLALLTSLEFVTYLTKLFLHQLLNVRNRYQRSNTLLTILGHAKKSKVYAQISFIFSTNYRFNSALR